MRQIVLDTETTGLDHNKGHRIIEIGCVELVNRKLTDQKFHEYINPKRTIDAEAIKVHGISNEFLIDKPDFADIAKKFIDFVNGAELIAHNATFDVGFLEAELKRIPKAPKLSDVIAGGKALDTYQLAREKRPGKRNSLDALCRDFKIDTSERTVHGALLDAELLTQVYLAMTREQSSIFGDVVDKHGLNFETVQKFNERTRSPRIIYPSADEDANHKAFLEHMRKKASPIWDEQ